MPTRARVRAFLENVAIPTTYPELTKALQILPPDSIQRVTEALERLMEEDAAADRSFIVNAGTRVLRMRSTSRPVRGRSHGQDATTFHAAELNAVFARWGGLSDNQQRGHHVHRN